MNLLCRRQFRLSTLLDIGLVLFLFALAFVYFNRDSIQQLSGDSEDPRDDVMIRPQSNSMTSSRRKKHRSRTRDDTNSSDSLDNIDKSAALPRGMPAIDSRVRIIEDARSSKCKRKSYVDAEADVSLILIFNDYEFYDVKNTIGSLLLFGNMDLIKEIIVVDDASALHYIIEESLAYFRSIPKLRLLKNRQKEPLGTPRARAMAVKEAVGEVLVFIDTSTICNRGWLEPILEQVRLDPKCIAVPHFDLIHDPVSLEYRKTPDNQVSTLTWSLSIRPGQGDAIEYEDTIPSPAIRGNVFALRKEFYNSIGGYDDELISFGGGEHIELSLRAWMCGGSVKIVPCSRVGILNLNDPVKVTAGGNVQRIAELWFGRRKSLVYRTLGLAGKFRHFDKSVIESATTRRESIGKCQHIDWYLETVATDLIAPRSDAIKFGILRVKTDRCSRLLVKSNKIKLDDCKPEHVSQHPPEMVFELTKDARLTVNGRCLTTRDNAYILADECRPEETKQLWIYKNEALINVWSRYCAMHVTDPDKSTEGDRQIMMAQECNSDTSKGELFKRWEFLVI